MTKKLNPKQLMFVKQYPIDLNATGAAIRSGYSPKTARAQGCRLLTNVYIKEAIAAALEKRSEKLECTAENVLKRIWLLANFNINKFMRYTEENQPYFDFSEATEDDWYCLDEITVDRIGRGTGEDHIEIDRVKLKAVSKIKALELAGRHIDIGAFRDKLEVEVIDRASIIQKARQRAAGGKK